MGIVDLETAIFDYVVRYDWATYAELQDKLGAVSNEKWNLSGSWAHQKGNIILWVGMSEEFAEAIENLQKQGKIHPHAAHFLTYLVDGHCLTLPLVKRNVAYKTEHWQPICFRTGPSCSNKGCPWRKAKHKASE